MRRSRSMTAGASGSGVVLELDVDPHPAAHGVDHFLERRRSLPANAASYGRPTSMAASSVAVSSRACADRRPCASGHRRAAPRSGRRECAARRARRSRPGVHRRAECGQRVLWCRDRGAAMRSDRHVGSRSSRAAPSTRHRSKHEKRQRGQEAGRAISRENVLRRSRALRGRAIARRPIALRTCGSPGTGGRRAADRRKGIRPTSVTTRYSATSGSTRRKSMPAQSRPASDTWRHTQVIATVAQRAAATKAPAGHDAGQPTTRHASARLERLRGRYVPEDERRDRVQPARELPCGEQPGPRPGLRRAGSRAATRADAREVVVDVVSPSITNQMNAAPARKGRASSSSRRKMRVDSTISAGSLRSTRAIVEASVTGGARSRDRRSSSGRQIPRGAGRCRVLRPRARTRLRPATGRMRRCRSC